jgi:hypothetical protein
MIETTRGMAAPAEVRLEAVRTRYGLVARVLGPGDEGGEVYRFVGSAYTWVPKKEAI